MTNIKRILLIGFSFFVSTCLTAQTNISLTSCDTTIADPTGVLFNTQATMTIFSGNGKRLAYSIEGFNSDQIGIRIYDGTSINSPLITTIGDYFTYPNQQYGGQTTGSYLTIKYFGVGTGNSQYFKIRVRCVETVINEPVFQTINSFPSIGGNVKKADYDKDGDEDLVIGGQIHRNDSYFDSLLLFERKINAFSQWSKAKISSADFDGDGDNDIFISGLTSSLGFPFRPMCAVYKNDGSGSFSLATNANTFNGAYNGGSSIIDFNRDGKPDICYTGSTQIFQNNPRIFKVYLNQGNNVFVERVISLPGFDGLMDATMSWADSDADGDKDLVINGVYGQNSVAKLYLRSGDSLIQHNLLITSSCGGSIEWVDVNKDGRPDIYNSGTTTPGHIDAISPEIYFNNGGNTFTKITTNLPRLFASSSDWSDYDSDNDMDVVICGFEPSGIKYTGILKNIGNGQFEKKGVGAMTGASTVKWADFNKDGKLDIIGVNGYYFKNMGLDSFKVSSFQTTALNSSLDEGIIEEFNGDGVPDMLYIGGLRDVDCNVENPSAMVLSKVWRYSAIPKFTQVADVRPLIPSLASSCTGCRFYYQWGDFDSDGKLDIIMTNDYYEGNVAALPTLLVVFKNIGNNNFSLYYDSYQNPLPLPPGYPSMPKIRYAGVFDMDNDGINELFLMPNLVYKRINNQWNIFFSTPASNSNTVGVGPYLDFADYNKDGFTDVLVGGGSWTTVFINENGRSLRNIATPGQNETFAFIGAAPLRQIQWADMDSDGDLDIVNSKVILENRNGNFFNVHSQLSSFTHAGVADINGDGYNDVVTTKGDLVGPNASGVTYGSLKVHYNQQGTMFFSEKEVGVLSPSNTIGFVDVYWNSSVVVFDIDNDGDNDIVSSTPMCNGGTSILVNEGRFTDSSINVLTPNGGEVWNINQTKQIKWSGYKLSNSVKIELSRDSGLTWQLINNTASSTSEGGVFNWNPTGPKSTNCLIRVTDNSNSRLIDKSNSKFTIDTVLIPKANAGRDTTICEGGIATLGVSETTNFSYTWTSNPAGFTSALPNPTVQPGVTTTFFLKVTDGISTSLDTVVVSVNRMPEKLADTLFSCVGRQYNIGLDSVAGYSYKWVSLPAGFTSTTANPIITITTTTKFYRTITNIQNNCRRTDSVFVKADSCLGGRREIISYPNPTHGSITIQGLNVQRQWQFLNLYNIHGIRVGSPVSINGRTIIVLNIENLPAGFYYVEVINAAGEKETLKVLKL